MADKNLTIEQKIQYGNVINQMTSAWDVVNAWKTSVGIEKPEKFWTDATLKPVLSHWLTLVTLASTPAGKNWKPGSTSSFVSLIWLNNVPFNAYPSTLGILSGIDFANASGVDSSGNPIIAFNYGMLPDSFTQFTSGLGRVGDYIHTKEYSSEQKRVILLGKTPDDLNCILPLAPGKGYFIDVIVKAETLGKIIKDRQTAVQDYRKAILDGNDSTLPLPTSREIMAARNVVKNYATTAFGSTKSIDEYVAIFNISHHKRGDIRTKDQGTADVNAYAHPSIAHSPKGVVNYLEQFALPIGILSNGTFGSPKTESESTALLQSLRVLSSQPSVFASLSNVNSMLFPATASLYTSLFLANPDKYWMFDMPSYTVNDPIWLNIKEVLSGHENPPRIMLKLSMPSANVADWAGVLKRMGFVYFWMNGYISENKIFVSNYVNPAFINMHYNLSDLVRIKSLITAIRNFAAVLAITGDMLNLDMSCIPGTTVKYQYVGFSVINSLFSGKKLWKIVKTIAEESKLSLNVTVPMQTDTNILKNWKKNSPHAVLAELCRLMNVPVVDGIIPASAPWGDYAFEFCDSYDLPDVATWSELCAVVYGPGNSSNKKVKTEEQVVKIEDFTAMDH